MESQHRSYVCPQNRCLTPWARMWLQWLRESLATMPCAVQDGNQSHHGTRTVKDKSGQKKKNTHILQQNGRQRNLSDSAWPLEKVTLPWEAVTPDLISPLVWGSNLYIQKCIFPSWSKPRNEIKVGLDWEYLGHIDRRKCKLSLEEYILSIQVSHDFWRLSSRSKI